MKTAILNRQLLSYRSKKSDKSFATSDNIKLIIYE